MVESARTGDATLVRVLVGNTPLVSVGGVYAKLECLNPCGSIKDRIAKYIIDESEKQGLLKPGMRIIEATSGNTGISLGYYARRKGYDITIVMPETATEERKRIIRSLGAQLILCSAEGSFPEAVAIRDRLSQTEGYFNPDQFSSRLNVECHYLTTGAEILTQIKQYTDGPIDAFTAGVGTGGTLIGVARALKESNPGVYIAAVEPAESAVLTGGEAGLHTIQGIGDGFIPAIVRGEHRAIHELVDETIQISSQDAQDAAQRLADEHGYCVGISSGANYLAARMLAKRFQTVVTVFPDGFHLYQSLGLKHNRGERCPYENFRINVLCQGLQYGCLPEG